MKTINFCGDSFCANLKKPQQWTNQLADKLDAKIIGYGKSGSAYIHAIESFDSSADYTVFCWTHKARLRSKNKKITYSLAIGNLIRSIGGTKKDLDCINYFYDKMYDPDLFEFYMRSSLYWFDTEVLSNYKGKLLHLYCFDNIYTFKNGHTPLGILTDLNPTVRAEGTVRFKKNQAICTITKKPFVEYSNHLSLEANHWLANYCYDTIKHN